MFKPENFFDLNETAYREIFLGVTNVWEVLNKISIYTKEHIRAEKKGRRHEHSYIEDNVEIGEGTVIEPNVVIKGPSIIGSNCQIRSGAYIRGNVLIGNNVIVGNSTEIKNSLLFNNVAVPHFNYIGDSILGFKTHLGAGVIFSNIKTPPGEIKIRTLEKIYSTGLQKFGAIIGDKTEIGCNAVLSPGSVIGKNCLIYPGVILRNIIAANSIVKLKQNQEIIIKLNKQ